MTSPHNLLGRVLSLFFMDRGLWSLGSVIIGTAASGIGIEWTFAACGSVCSVAAVSLLWANYRRREARAERASKAAIIESLPEQGLPPHE
jgi:hypothetical protein